jgi:hypothetical protein
VFCCVTRAGYIKIPHRFTPVASVGAHRPAVLFAHFILICPTANVNIHAQNAQEFVQTDTTAPNRFPKGGFETRPYHTGTSSSIKPPVSGAVSSSNSGMPSEVSKPLSDVAPLSMLQL